MYAKHCNVALRKQVLPTLTKPTPTLDVLNHSSDTLASSNTTCFGSGKVSSGRLLDGDDGAEVDEPLEDCPFLLTAT